MDTVDHINHAVSIVGYWIFDSKYKNSLPLKIDSLNLICSPSEGEELFAWFEKKFTQSDLSKIEENIYRWLVNNIIIGINIFFQNEWHDGILTDYTGIYILRDNNE